MSQPGLANSNYKLPKRDFSVYSMLLILSFIALVIGCVLLHNEILKWGGMGPPRPWDTRGLNVPNVP